VLKYVFAAIFVALAWALVLVFHDSVPLWPAIVATAVIVVGLIALAIFRVIAAQKAALKIEKGLRDQAAQHAGGVRPDMAGEIAAMEAEFQKGVQALKSSKVGRSGRDALSLLPWYVMIGPSASGKTTAIRSSGLKMPSGKSGKVRGVGGTRNCDWWMTNEAILLDTAGRWSTDDDDRDEWLAFLDLLKKTRPKKPINGILLAFSATDLQGTEEEIGELATNLRERIDEVISHLEVVVPVYLIVTKCDLVSGFVETFGELKDRERGQILGFSLPIVSEHDDNVEAFAQHFDDLTDVLERNALLRMGEERRIDAREWIYAFPQQFDSLRQGLVDLIATLFDKSVYQEAPIMRGVYFTSGTQEGRPVDRIMANMAEAFGVRPRVTGAPPAKPKSYFVRDVFQRVVFPDRDVAVRSAGVLRKQRMLRWGTAAGALAVSAAVLVLPISSYLENQRLISDARAFVDKLSAARADHQAPGPFAPPPLESAEPMATRLARFAVKGPDFSLRFGLYPGDRLMDPLRVAVERLVVRPLLDADADQLLAYARGRADVDGSGAMGGLMLHLLLTQPKAPDEPAPGTDGWREHMVDAAADQASERWAAVAGDAATTRARHTLEGAVRFYALGIEATEDLLERKPTVVSRVRGALLGATEGDPLADVLRDPNMPRDIRLIDIVAGAVTVFQTGANRQSGPSVPGAFTPAGWQIVKERIKRLTTDHEHDENAWVLAAPRKREGADAAALQAAYFRRYVDSWKTFLLSLSVKEPANIDEVRALLKAFLMDRPLDAIWRNASKSLVFKDESPLGGLLNKGKASLGKRLGDAKKTLMGEAGGADAAGDDAAAAKGAGGGKPRGEEPTSPEDVGREFGAFLNFGMTKPTGLEAYGQILAELSGAVGEQGAPEPKAFQAAIKAQRIKLSNLITNYNENGWEAGLLEKILMPPLRGAEVAVNGATGDSASRKWCESIVVVYDQLLAGKYPFVRGKGVREAHVDDVQKFFQPKTGTLWQYFTESLAADIEHPAGTTLFTVKDQPSVKLKPTLPGFLKRAQEVTDLMFAKDPAKLGLTVSIRIRPSAPYTKIVFESGGKKITYFNAKERWEEIPWPSRGALFHYYFPKGEGELGYTDGEWALFHLLEDGKLTTSSEGEEYLAGTWSPPLGEGVVHADVKPAALLRAFRGLEMPRSIVAGAAGCGR
jgi:type VI secretion system protein ImpL